MQRDFKPVGSGALIVTALACLICVSLRGDEPLKRTLRDSIEQPWQKVEIEYQLHQAAFRKPRLLLHRLGPQKIVLSYSTMDSDSLVIAAVIDEATAAGIIERAVKYFAVAEAEVLHDRIVMQRVKTLEEISWKNAPSSTIKIEVAGRDGRREFTSSFGYYSDKGSFVIELIEETAAAFNPAKK